MTSFDSLGLSERALEAVGLLGYAEPTPVQQQAIPLVLEGRDVIAAAKTGTGKTAAFSLPLLDRIGYAGNGEGPRLLVITPTRELAQQIGEVCERIAQTTHHRILTVVGGLSYTPQIERLKRGVDVLIATPGRLIDLMDQDAVRLGSLEALVLDEADRMLDMGFWPSVKRITAAVPAARQTLLFSATIDDAVEKHAKTLLRNPASVEVAHRGEVADTIDQYLIRTPKLARPELLRALLAEKGHKRVIVFTRTRRGADTVCRRLKKAGYTAEPIHANRTQNARKRTLERFSAGEVDIVVATDVLARGIDVDRVEYVVNYDLPTPPESYVHRIGRTGRAGEEGFAVSFVTPETEEELAAIRKLIKQDIPELRLSTFSAEDAELAAAAKQGKWEQKADPDIAQAKKELAARARKKRKQAGHTEEGAPVKRGAGKRAGASAPEAASRRATGSAGKKGRSAAAGASARGGAPKTAPRAKAAPARTGRAGGAAGGQKARPSSHGDFRPGRAHRADMARRRGGRG
ncbi:MAG TPA: DEAD/DEAH box helicase [Candidatus Aphodovivens avistercoris]|nr:DEAD/DEAH box helicase [Candidatus Aphodovivens avistercoris]